MSDVRIALRTGTPIPPVSHRRASARPLTRGRIVVRSQVARRVGLGLALGLGAVMRVMALPHQPTPGTPEAALITQVVDVTRWAMDPSHGPAGIPVSAAAIQLAALCAVIGSWNWAPSVLDAVRDAGLPLWLLASAQVWVLARRLGADATMSAGALAILAVGPMAVQASMRATPENLAAIGVLAATLLVLPQQRVEPPAQPEQDRRWSAPLAGVILGLAACATPVALAVTPMVVLLLARRADSWRAVMTWALALAVVLGGAVTLGVGPAADQFTWFAPGWLSDDPVTPALGLVVGLIALAQPRWREIALGLLIITVVGCSRGASGAALVLPLALALGAAVLTGWRHRPSSGRLRIRARWGAALVAAAAVLAWSSGTLPWPETTAVPSVSARAWLTENLPADQPLRADLPARAALASGLADWGRFATEHGCRARWWSGCSSPWWVGQSSAPGQGWLVAQFGIPDRRGGLAVRTQQPRPPDPAAELHARQLAGVALASSPGLVMAPPLAEQLRAGLLDPRACTALGALASNQRIRLLELAAVPGDTATIRRQLTIAPDGPAPNGDSSVEGELSSISAYFQAQLQPFRPFAMATTPTGVQVRYSPYVPPGLLTAFLPPT